GRFSERSQSVVLPYRDLGRGRIHTPDRPLLDPGIAVCLSYLRRGRHQCRSLVFTRVPNDPSRHVLDCLCAWLRVWGAPGDLVDYRPGSSVVSTSHRGSGIWTNSACDTVLPWEHHEWAESSAVHFWFGNICGTRPASAFVCFPPVRQSNWTH